jgi:hypothetical protein
MHEFQFVALVAPKTVIVNFDTMSHVDVEYNMPSSSPCRFQHGNCVIIEILNGLSMSSAVFERSFINFQSATNLILPFNGG